MGKITKIPLIRDAINKLITTPLQGLKNGASRALSSFSNKIGTTAARACSFTGSTMVLLADGTTKPIEEIQIGDMVVATDPQTGEQQAKPVVEVFVHQDTVIEVVIGEETINTTEDHPFWSVDTQTFKRADQLQPGENVLAANGETVKVTALKLDTPQQTLAYNLEIQDIHTYHIGQTNTLVHNTCDPVRAVTADFVASADGTIVPTSKSVMIEGFEAAGLETFPTKSEGIGYILPDGNKVRIMEPSGRNGLRASFTNAFDDQISPFTNRQVQPPRGLSQAGRNEFIGSRTHVNLTP